MDMSTTHVPPRTSMTTQNPLATLGHTVLRAVLGITFLLHGWQKFNEWTIAGTQASFGEMGVPAADIAAPAVAVLELAGGALLVIGLATRVIAALLTVNMLGALVLVHLPAGFFAGNGGYELVLLLAAAALLFVLAGAGRWSVDHVIASRRGTRSSAESTPVAA